MRLVDGSYPSEGRVEVFLYGIWGTVTSGNFDTYPDARIICTSLGYGGVANSIPWSVYGQGTGPIHINDLSCNEFDSSILDCSYSGSDSSNYKYMDASVRCQGAYKQYG